MLQSIWAVAAQYCQQETTLKVRQVGQQSPKHDVQEADSKNVSSEYLADSSKTNVGNDCPYCHLGSIKYMTNNLTAFEAYIEPAVRIDIYYSYPEIIPLKPERPNWNLAV